jgi:hypothetical protein
MAKHAPKDSPVARLAGSYQDVSDYLDIRAYGVIAVTLLLLIVLLAIVVVHLTWSSWQKRDVERFFRGEPIDLGGFHAVGFVVTVLFVATMASGMAVRKYVGWTADAVLACTFTIIIVLTFGFVLYIVRSGEDRARSLLEFKRTRRQAFTRFTQFAALAVPLSLGANLWSRWLTDWDAMLVAVPLVAVAAIARRALEMRWSRAGDWLVRQSVGARGATARGERQDPRLGRGASGVGRSVRR